MKLLNQKGFTLIEMMIVLFVISILTLFVLPKASAYINKAQTEGCEAYEKSLEAQEAVSDFLGSDFETNQDDYSKLCK